MAGTVLTTNGGRLAHIHEAGSSRWRFYGVAAFTTTATTMELNVRDIKVIRAFGFAVAGSGTGGEIPSIDETVNSDGTITVPSDGNLTITRAAGTTSGLKFSFWFEG